MKVKFRDGTVLVDPPKKPKKITGTRFGAVLDTNRWQTPFQAWCEITKAYQKPYEDTIYTKAGKVIESKQLDWFSTLLPIVRPEEIYGKDFFNKTFGDFFKESEIFGGMWDSLVGTKQKFEGVIECKTTKRAEDWYEDVPEYYALQAALYAYLLGLEDVYMIVSFLDDGDYEFPEKYVVNADNTTYVHFKVHKRYPEFDSYVMYCERFWRDHVLTGISPEYDEKADKEYLDALRTEIIDNDTDMNALVAEAEKLYAHIESVKASVAADEKRLKEIEGMMKTYAIEHESEGQNKAVFQGNTMTWTITKSVKKSVNVELMQEKGIYDDFLTETESYTIRKSINKGE